MSIPKWLPPVELSDRERFVVSRLKRTGKLYVFLREYRHELFDDSFQTELEAMYSDAPYGTAPRPPAMLAMVTLLQAYQQASDAVAVENAVLDRRWQMVLACLDAEEPLFSQGVLVDFRRRLIDHDMDRRLLERTVELARETGAFGHKALRVALDSAPLWGARRVEDTFNLIGHAMEVVVECAAIVAEETPDEVRRLAGTKLLGHSSIKAALDIDWDDKAEQKYALERLVDDAAALSAWVTTNLASHTKKPPLKEALDLLALVIQQDIEPDPDGSGSRIREGTSKDRRISVEDGEMRHGRKSKSRVINGYKRHIAADIDSGLVLATAVRPANEKEFSAEIDLRPDVARLGEVAELHIDRGYLSGTWPREMHEQGRPVLSKPWSGQTDRFSKADFDFDFDSATVTCPAGANAPIRRTSPDRPARASFPTATCRACDLRSSCLPASTKSGRCLNLHEAEPLLHNLRQIRKTPAGRAQLRERVVVEHRLAHICARQGRRARYVGTRKNNLDMRRTAAVENLHCIQRMAA